jgi:hypothetical protein
MIDESAHPVMRNSQSESMDIFIQDFERGLHDFWESDKLVKDEVYDFG